MSHKPTDFEKASAGGWMASSNLATEVGALDSDERLAGSVTGWLPGVKKGESTAQARLVARFYSTVLRLANQRLPRNRKRAQDEDDVASEVFRQFLKQAQASGFRKLRNRSDVEEILSVITRRRSTDAVRSAQAREKHELGESAFGYTAENAIARPVACVSDEQLIREKIQELFSSADCQRLKLASIALLKSQGYSADEIAERVGELRRTVYRRLDLIRQRLMVTNDLSSELLNGTFRNDFSPD